MFLVYYRIKKERKPSKEDRFHRVEKLEIEKKLIKGSNKAKSREFLIIRVDICL